MNSQTPAAERASPSHAMPCKIHAIVSWIAQIVSAVILGQTLFFKFSGAPEAVYIFSTLHAEPWGRLGTGVMELIAAVLLLIPRTAVIGAALALGLMGGAIASHLGPLGIVVKDDGGLLFALAITVAAMSSIVLVMRKRQAIALARCALAKVRATKAA